MVLEPKNMLFISYFTGLFMLNHIAIYILSNIKNGMWTIFKEVTSWNLGYFTGLKYWI